MSEIRIGSHFIGVFPIKMNCPLYGQYKLKIDIKQNGKV
jgi:hypothetical protein